MGDRYDSIRSEAEPWSERGCRVLLLAAYDTAFDDGPLQSAHVAPIALVFLSNLLRPDAQETFRYFASQGVSVRVISGDNPITVAQVAARAGIENADRYVDAMTLSTEQDFEELSSITPSSAASRRSRSAILSAPSKSRAIRSP